MFKLIQGTLSCPVVLVLVEERFQLFELSPGRIQLWLITFSAPRAERRLAPLLARDGLAFPALVPALPAMMKASPK